MADQRDKGSAKFRLPLGGATLQFAGVNMSASRHKNRVLPICYAVWTTRMRSIVFIAAVAASTLTPASAQEALPPTFYSRLPAATLASRLTLLDTTRKIPTNPAVGPAVLGSLVGSIAGGLAGLYVGAIADCGPDMIKSECGLAGAFYGLAVGWLVGSTLGATVATRRFKCAPPGNFRRAALGTVIGSLGGALLISVHNSAVLLVPVGQLVGTGMSFKRC